MTPINEIPFGPFVLNLAERRLWCDGVRVRLKAREAELLGLLVERRHRVIAKDEIIEHLWGGAATDAALAQTVYRLRQKLHACSGRQDFIKTIPGVGFQFTGATQSDSSGERVDVLSSEYASYQVALEAYRQRTASSIQNAIRSLEELQERHPHFLPAIIGLARAYTVIGIRRLCDPQKAYRMAHGAVERILNNDPRSAEAYATLALLLLFYDGDLEGAHVATQQALVFAPNSSFARKAAFWDRLASRDFPAALAEADRLVQFAPASSQSMALVATGLYMSRRYHEAQQCFDMALELDPLNCTALHYAASTCIALENYGDAEDILSLAAQAGVMGTIDDLRRLLAVQRGGSHERDTLIRHLSSLATREPSRFLLTIDPLYAPFASVVTP